jgi:hypothetical protein
LWPKQWSSSRRRWRRRWWSGEQRRRRWRWRWRWRRGGVRQDPLCNVLERFEQTLGGGQGSVEFKLTLREQTSGPVHTNAVTAPVVATSVASVQRAPAKGPPHGPGRTGRAARAARAARANAGPRPFIWAGKFKNLQIVQNILLNQNNQEAKRSTNLNMFKSLLWVPTQKPRSDH